MSVSPPWRDFLNRREPGARGMLLVLVTLWLVQTGLLFFGPVSDVERLLPAVAVPPIITLAAIFTCRRWSLPCAPAFPDPKWEIPPSAQRWLWLMTAAIALLALWSRSQRMAHGFSDAEEMQLSQAAQYADAGETAEGFRPDMSGQWRLVMDRVAAQFAVEVMDEPPGDAVPRDARVLPWAAGIVSAGLIVLLAAALGSPRAGVAAGMTAAMHPLWVRLGSEVNDVPLQMLALGLAVWCVLQAFQNNRWRWWAGLGSAQGLYMLGHPQGALDLLMLNLAAAAVLVRAPVPRNVRSSHLLRLLAAAALAGAVHSVPFNTAVPSSDSSGILWTQLLAGVPWQSEAGDMARGATLAGMAAQSVWRAALLYGVLPLCAAAGCWFLLRHDWRTRLAGIAFLLGGLTATFGGSAVPLLLLFPVVLVWGGAGLMRLFPGRARMAHAPLFIAVAYVLATAPALQRMLHLPQQPLREALAAAVAPGGTVAAAGRLADAPAARRAGIMAAENPGQLDALADAAFESDRPLLVLCPAGAAEPGSRRLREALDSDGRFVPVREFPAFDPANDIRMYRFQVREQIINLQLKPDKR